MFKTLFKGGFALLLVLSLIFQAAPALAQGDDPAPPGVIPDQVLVKITRVSLLPGYPPQLKIEGELPSNCFRAKAQVILGRQLPVLKVIPIRVRVYAVQRATRMVCADKTEPFSLTVTLDLTSLELQPGRYLALVNGLYRFRTWLKMPVEIPVMGG